jgi:type I restriction enzyme R subunit
MGEVCQNLPYRYRASFPRCAGGAAEKADINATDVLSRTYGTLGVLRHGIKSHNARFSLCQFKPEHNLNPETLTRYKQNICRIVPELVYSPHASNAAFEETGVKAKKWRIDLCCSSMACR